MLLVAGAGQTQNLFDLSHSVRYADHLLRDGRYPAARQAYQQALALAPGNAPLLFGLMRSYRLDGQPEAALQAAGFYATDTTAANPLVVGEVLLTLLDLRRYDTLAQAADALPAHQRADWQVGSLLMQRRWQAARAALPPLPRALRARWTPLVEQGLALRYKKPWLATALSTVVPGTGRMYAGRWGDGLLSLANVGIFTWQAYRGFDRRGARSFYGWFNAFFGVSFYVGNVYGSHRAAVLYNEKKNQQISRVVEPLLRADH